MKGRRKVRTDKWQFKEQVIKEARAILATRAVIGGHFLDLAAQSTLEEPVEFWQEAAGHRRVHSRIHICVSELSPRTGRLPLANKAAREPTRQG